MSVTDIHTHEYTATGSGAATRSYGPRLRDRLLVRLRARKLDHALAAGADSDTDVGLALRARQLTAQAHRRWLAETLRAVVSQAHTPFGDPSFRTVPCRTRVLAASEELVRLANTLSGPGPVAVCGVAQTQILLTDGTGPMYNSSSGADLRVQTTTATKNLARN